MSRTEFIVTTAIILFVAFCLGWFAHWLVHRFTRVSRNDMGELDRMAQNCTRPRKPATRRSPTCSSARPS